MYGTVVVVVVTTTGNVVVVTTGSVVGVVTGGTAGAGHITAAPNRLHWLISFVRQRLNFPRFVIQPHVCVIALPHTATHSARVDTTRASACPLAITAARMVMIAKRF